VTVAGRRRPRRGFSIARTLLIAAMTGAVGFLGLIVAREYGLARGRAETVRDLEDRARRVTDSVRGVVGAPDPAPAPAAPALRRPADPRVLVLKERRTVQLFDGRTLLAEWPCRLGPHPVGPKQAEGDGRTPEGLYYVCTKNPFSKFHRFLGISYPGIADADRGLAAGRATPEQAEAVRRAIAARRPPPWNTSLGGEIGLHGTGGPERPGDWTAGCIAMSDEAAETLARVLEIGDPVEIRP
jgi:hypothetical protein